MSAPQPAFGSNRPLRQQPLVKPQYSSRVSDRERIEAELGSLVFPAGMSNSAFREAMRYAVMGGGQRIRPLLALRLARIAGGDETLLLRAASAIELIHCASLIVDDLPSMDNAATRRGKPAVHVVFGEATALLAAFGLVALAARTPFEVVCAPSVVSGVIRFQSELLKVLDASGLCEGQDLDLRVSAGNRDEMRARVNELKTVPLFELCAHAALICSDQDNVQARAMKMFSREFGRAFQLVDDYLDGEIADTSLLHRTLDTARRCLLPLEPAAGELHELVDYLNERASE